MPKAKKRPAKRSVNDDDADKDDKKHGAVKYKYGKNRSQAFIYKGLKIDKEWPVRPHTVEHVKPMGNPTYDGDTVIHFNVVAPQNHFVRCVLTELCINKLQVV